jgi:hypothetical protein
MKLIENGILDLKPTLDEYFHSIEPTFRARGDSTNTFYDGFSTSLIFFLGFFFSLIPLIPALMRVVVKYFFPVHVYSFWDVKLSNQSFLFWYLISSAISGILFILRLRYSSFQEKKINLSRPSRPERLSKHQLRFALCYSVEAEIDLYRINKRNIHIDTATKLWREFMDSLEHMFGFGYAPMSPADRLDIDLGRFRLEREGLPSRRSPKGQFFPDVQAQIRQFSWFKLDVRTAEVIRAFDSLTSKLSGRIADRKDLFEVSQSLFPLSSYLYSEIPDLADTEIEKGTLADLSSYALGIFTEEMEKLTFYSPEEKSIPMPTKAEASKARIAVLLDRTVSNRIPFIKFCSIWLIFQIFCGVAVFGFISEVKGLKFDSTLIALLIGSPFAVAATLTAIPNSKRVDENPNVKQTGGLN